MWRSMNRWQSTQAVIIIKEQTIQKSKLSLLQWVREEYIKIACMHRMDIRALAEIVIYLFCWKIMQILSNPNDERNALT